MEKQEEVIRIATWNCCRGNYYKKKERLLGLCPDICVVQEAVKPKLLRTEDHWSEVSNQIGIALYCSDKYSIEPAEINEAAALSILPFKIKGENDYNLLAVWTREEHGYIKGLNTALDVYSSFLKEKPSFVIGDFNANAIWNKPKAKFDFGRLAHRLENEFGYKSAYHDYFREKYGEESLPTHYFTWDPCKQFHIDYIYIPKDFSIKSVSVGDYMEWAKVSDHRPLVVDL